MVRIPLLVAARPGAAVAASLARRRVVVRVRPRPPGEWVRQQSASAIWMLAGLLLPARFSAPGPPRPRRWRRGPRRRRRPSAAAPPAARRWTAGAPARGPARTHPGTSVAAMAASAQMPRKSTGPGTPPRDPASAQLRQISRSATIRASRVRRQAREVRSGCSPGSRAALRAHRATRIRTANTRAAAATPMVITSITPENGSSLVVPHGSLHEPPPAVGQGGQARAQEREDDAQHDPHGSGRDLRGQLVDRQGSGNQGQGRADPGQERPLVGQGEPVIGGGPGLPPRWFAHSFPPLAAGRHGHRRRLLSPDRWTGPNSTLPAFRIRRPHRVRQRRQAHESMRRRAALRGAVQRRVNLRA